MTQLVEVIPRSFKLIKSNSSFSLLGEPPALVAFVFAFPTAFPGEVTRFLFLCLLRFQFLSLLLDGGKLVNDNRRVSSSFFISPACLRVSTSDTYPCFSAFSVTFVVLLLSA